ncbi:MAG TPA: Lrp/AsnC family transcriptional regulator [Micromonosporaceae bacterium]|nr:Lrp/AsnC family transcriptional regulator [Micromonosporaceae bacterium]
MDSTDRRILEMLTENARMSYAEMARQIGLSGPAVHERVGKLEASGVIRAYRASLDPEAVGLGVTAFIGIVESPDSEFDSIVTAIADFPEVESCYFTAGAESFLLQVRVPAIADLERLIVRLNRIPGVASTRTTIALSTKWEGRPQALPADAP